MQLHSANIQINFISYNHYLCWYKPHYMFSTKKLMGIIVIDDSLTDCTQTNNLPSIMYWKLVDTGYQGGEILEITWKEREEKYLRFYPLANF